MTTNKPIRIMLKKIDCVMIKVRNVGEAAKFYSSVLGLIPKWNYDGNIGLRFPESDSEIGLNYR